jgi:2,4-dienoyl-CoA reductase-like NADH-dependent reductase (Old Yellow Enzyme family)/siroheme synthase (precorrin-2 oxidase/ferrochelatase)
VLEHLLSPFRIGAMELRNRIAMAPMGVEIVEGDGQVREPVVRYYEERARGGAGLLITENTSACYPRGANSAHEIGVSNDEFIPGLRLLTDRVHEHGAKIAIQLAHHGKVSRLDTLHGRELLMPSPPRKQAFGGPLDLTVEEMTAMAKAAGGGKPQIREATHEDLVQLVEDFGDAAARAQTAGFDAVEIHGAHGYIFSEFLSGGWNFRSDEYGGPVENRARLLCDTIRKCKQRTGGNFPVWARIDAVEFRTQNGIEFADAQRTAELLEAAGADAIHVSAYSNPMGAGFTEGPLVHREAGYVDFAAGIKARVSVPVIAVGRIEPELGDQLIREGKADLVSMGRKLLADPALARKLHEGRPEDIRPCVYCYTCVAQPFFDRRVRCAVNPVTANEQELAELERTPASDPKHVLIVGGGPAGMEAARVAAARGHRVTLVEKASQLGGTLRFAALMYEPNERLLRWLETQVRKAQVDVQLSCSADAALVRKLAPDVVLVAAGAQRERPEIAGVDSDHVFDGDDLRALLTGEGAEEASGKLSLAGRLAVKAGRLTGVSSDPAKLREASRAYMPVGKRVAVVGGGLVGVELAEFLAERGRRVTVLEEGPVLATEMAHPRRWRVLHELREAKVDLIENARVSSIESDRVEFDVGSGDDAESRSVPADTVILASGLIANPRVGMMLAEAGVPVVEIGDVTGVGYIEGAIYDGYRAAIDI